LEKLCRLRTRIKLVNFVKKIVQGTRPLGAIILVKFPFFSFGAVNPHPWTDQGEIWHGGADLHAKFHLDRCSVLPLRGEKPENRPVNKNNTGRAALRADPAGKKSENHHISSSHADVRRAISTKFCMVIKVVHAIILGPIRFWFPSIVFR